jgi:hypothetical protein
VSLPLEVLRDLPGYVVRLNEALEDGDIDLAREIARGLEETLTEANYIPPLRFACSNCDLRFAWPGELDDHYRNVHWGEPWRRAA